MPPKPAAPKVSTLCARRSANLSQYTTGLTRYVQAAAAKPSGSASTPATAQRKTCDDGACIPVLRILAFAGLLVLSAFLVQSVRDPPFAPVDLDSPVYDLIPAKSPRLSGTALKVCSSFHHSSSLINDMIIEVFCLAGGSASYRPIRPQCSDQGQPILPRSLVSALLLLLPTLTATALLQQHARSP